MGKKRTLPTATVRLHISPLTPATASALLPADTDLSTISYHTLQTFPDAPFAYVDLPPTAAEKLKRKLNGAMFRGAKVRVENARPEEEWKEKIDGGDDAPKRRKKVREVEDGVLTGVALPDGRRIARGWAEKGERRKEKDGEKKENKKERRDKSKAECLFKLAVPANKADLLPLEDKAARKERRKEKKAKRVLHEFEHLEKFPAFLKSSQLDPSRGPEDLVGGFEEGVGWVDAKGNVVEQPPKKKDRKERKREAKEAAAATEAAKEAVAVKEPTPQPEVVTFEEAPILDAMDIDDAVSVSSEEVFRDVPDTAEEPIPVAIEESEESDNEPGEAEKDGSESEDKEDESLDEPSDEGEAAVTSKDTQPSLAKIQPEVKSSDGEEAPAKAAFSPREKPTLPPLTTTIHPLEALYKPTALAATTTEAEAPAFKFGFSAGRGDDDDDDDDAPATITTPYRDPNRYRSSAPTPDTAIGTKRFFSPTSLSDDASVDFAPSTPRAPFSHKPGADAPLLFLHEESRFLKGLSVWQNLPQPKALLPVEPGENEEVTGGEPAEKITDPVELWKKQFYESRGEWNRDWKRRRREGLKAKRKRERTGPGASGANRA